MKILIAIIIFSLLVLFHELGHFLLAKLNHITVLEFSLGIGPRIISHEFKGTKYSLKLLPFGGSCSMLGEEEGDMGEGSFGSKSPGARAQVILAGPIFNFILAFVFALILVIASGVDDTRVDNVISGGAASEAGIKSGDVIESLNNNSTHIWDDISLYNFCHQGEKVKVKYIRDGKEKTTVVVPKKDKESGAYYIGISSDGKTKKSNIKNIIPNSYYIMKYQFNMTFQSLKMLFTGKASIKEMTGVVGIVSIIGDTYSNTVKVGKMFMIAKLLGLSVMLSISIGIMNLLPIPALDGGRFVFIIIEWIRGKRINPKIEETINIIGFILLILLMIFIMINDFRYHIF